MNRIFLGLSVGSGLEGFDAAMVRAEGVGLDIVPRVGATVRVAFPLPVRDALRNSAASREALGSPEFVRIVADTAIHAARQALTNSGISPRDTFAAGLLEPARPNVEFSVDWSEIADRVAEQTGLTLIHGFRLRDRAAGGTGHPITAAADCMLFRSPSQHRLLIHLGAVTFVLLAPTTSGKLASAIGFEAGPGNQLLDALVFHGTRGKETSDPGGKKAVQGRCLEPLLARWLEHPHLTRMPPKTVHPEAFGRSFLLAAFETARDLGAGLPDLLCTATHLVARAVGDAVRCLPSAVSPRQVLASGGGVRNGFLWQLVAQQLNGETIARTDEAGVPALARNASAAAVLAALTCDGVPGNHASFTGASGGRLLGHLVPGDGRNWAKVTAWIAEQVGEYPRVNRAA